jgi:anti-anti-sigma regulatory factor
MDIEITIQQTDDDPVAVMKLKGDINASNFMEVVDKAREIYAKPAHNLIIDLGAVSSVSTTGVVALHKIALIYSGVQQEMDTAAPSREMRPDFTHSANARKFVKLASPQPDVDKALEKAGMKLFFKIFGDLDSALKSFD